MSFICFGFGFFRVLNFKILGPDSFQKFKLLKKEMTTCDCKPCDHSETEHCPVYDGDWKNPTHCSGCGIKFCHVPAEQWIWDKDKNDTWCCARCFCENIAMYDNNYNPEMK
jgi:hypothetical protein